MAEQDWVRPQAPPEPEGSAWPRQATKQFELRPLSLGEVLDRTFALYRSRFLLFAGISMIAAAINVVGQGISLSVMQGMVHQIGAKPASSPAAVLASLRDLRSTTLVSYLVGLLFVLVSAVTHAATALALTEVYQGRVISVGGALRRILPRWYRWIGIAIWQSFTFAWIPCVVLLAASLLFTIGSRGGSFALTVIAGLLFMALIFGALPAGVILYLRNALAVPAAVAEGLTVRPAMRRSKVLAAGAKGRVFVVLLIAFFLLEVVGVLQSPIGILMLLAPNQQHYLARAISLLVTFVGHTVVAPVALIGLTLVYFDQRVRKEALDLELLLRDAQASEAAAYPGEQMHGHAE